MDEIDQDHRVLVGLFNLLNHAVADNEASNYIEAILDELVACTAWHFKHEERLMLKHEYPGIDEHRLDHRELIQSAQAIQQRVSADNPLSAVDIQYLDHWLTGHILGPDMELGNYLAEVM